MNLYLDLDFGSVFKEESFFFGVANAPYLCEGGFNTPEGPKNSYGYFEAEGKVPPSGDTTSFWRDYEQHVALAARHGLNAFRMGIEWARVQPTRELAEAPAPAWDHEAVAHYARILAAVERAGMQPVVTLHHFTHPAWLGKTLWLRDDAVEVVVGYELRIAEELNELLVADGLAPIGNIVTFNELNLLPPKCLTGSMRHASYVEAGLESYLAVYDTVLTAHTRVYDGLKEMYDAHGWPEPLIGFGTATQAPYELDKMMLDVVRVRTAGIPREGVGAFIAERRAAWTDRLSGLARRKLTDAQYAAYRAEVDAMAEALRAVDLTRALDTVYASREPRKIDYISANVYEPFRTGRALGDARRSPQWWEFAADGDIYRTMILAYNDGNDDLPMFMGENSLAYRQDAAGRAVPRPDGWTRERYFKTYLMEMVRCIAEGVPIRGYLYWSLVDDFEWDAGFAPRLGLHNYDYVSHEIGATDGLGEPAGEIYADLIRSLRSGDKSAVRRAFVEAWR